MDAIFVVGAGGIGCAVGYALLVSNAPVIFVETDPQKLSWGAAQGVCVDNRPHLAAKFIAFDDWKPPPGATVILCTKCYDNASVLDRLADEIDLVPIQNGFDPNLDERAHSIEGIASFVSECRTGRTWTRITRRGCLHLGPRGSTDRKGQSRLQALAGLLQQAGLFRVKVVLDVLPYKRTKLMYNAAIGPLAALAGLDNGELLKNGLARVLFFQLLRENYSILRDTGLPMGKIGPFHPNTVSRILAHPMLARGLAWAFYPSLRGTYCSMNGDLPKGRTELENYTGYLLGIAGATPCELNGRIYSRFRQMEEEEFHPSLSHLEWLARGLGDLPIAA